MPDIYRRPELAAQMTRQLLRPGVLDEGLRSGLFLSGLRRTGKTTFLLNDLIPALEEAGALVIYVLIIGYYAYYMNRLDREYGVEEGED